MREALRECSFQSGDELLCIGQMSRYEIEEVVNSRQEILSHSVS